MLFIRNTKVFPDYIQCVDIKKIERNNKQYYIVDGWFCGLGGEDLFGRKEKANVEISVDNFIIWEKLTLPKKLTKETLCP
jgi:hypothetical protein